ncbi:3'-5' exonuclease [Pseudomonas oryzihabitans]|uniref:3'-5' exonuclease n=1 Tax=Pseudomonas oryzihabitans TaxID=47885 RepID=UPI0028947FFC|nr:3'-5' exonuclease [Pseudomonas oryzihabitans]MDT3720320.1 3'-5' exonuclease [Pseudomonas oryzihabitans]
MSRVDVVIDLETMGTSPRAAIVALGAVALHAEFPRPREYYGRVDLADSVAQGGVFDAETVQWWMQQSEEARHELVGSLAQPLHAELRTLSLWLEGLELNYGDLFIWGNSPAFDCTILGSAYDSVGLSRPWHFRQERDLRTLLDLYPEAADIEFEGVKHHAMHDARHEARMLAKALDIHRERATALASQPAVFPLDAGELVATVTTILDGTGWKSLDFHVDLQQIPDGTELYAAAHTDKATRDVLAERQRQIEAEGFTLEGDDGYGWGALALAASCYAQHAHRPDELYGKAPESWPWAWHWWKPGAPRRNLVKAGALIIAEIQRLDRVEQPPEDSNGEASQA